MFKSDVKTIVEGSKNNINLLRTIWKDNDIVYEYNDEMKDMIKLMTIVDGVMNYKLYNIDILIKK